MLIFNLMKKKVLIYLTRQNNDISELLVFKHNKPWSPYGFQVPGGGIKDNEAMFSAAIRELQEESGIPPKLLLSSDKYPIDSYIYYRSHFREYNQRFIFHFTHEQSLPNTWKHKIQSLDFDNEMTFTFSWLPIKVAQQKLVDGMGLSLKFL